MKQEATMWFLRKSPYITLNSLTTLRRLITIPAAKPFPDEPTVAYYDELADAAGRSGDFDALRDVLNKRIQDGFKNTKRTFNFVTRTNFSPSLLDNLVHALSNLNQGLTRRNALESLVTRLCKLGRADEALSAIDSLARGGACAPTLCAFYPVLNHLTRAKSLAHARRVMEIMAGHGIAPDATAHNFFLKTHCLNCNLEAAAGVLRRMEEEGLAVDARTFDALVIGACKAGKVDGAVVLVRRMVDDGVSISDSTHMYVVGTLLKMKCYELSIKYVRVFVGRNELLDAKLLGCLASKLMNLNRVKEAMSILEEMKQKGVPMGFKLHKFYEKNVGSANGARVDGGGV